MKLIERIKSIFPFQITSNKNQPKNNSDSKFVNITNKENEKVKTFREILGDEIFISEDGKESFKVNKEIKKEQNQKCNHNPNDKNTSLLMMPRRTMIQPPVFDFVCSECEQIFKFTRDKETKQYIKL